MPELGLSAERQTGRNQRETDEYDFIGKIQRIQELKVQAASHLQHIQAKYLQYESVASAAELLAYNDAPLFLTDLNLTFAEVNESIAQEGTAALEQVQEAFDVYSLFMHPSRLGQKEEED